MKIVRSALASSILGSALALLVFATIATAQDPKNPQLPDLVDPPPSRVAPDRESDRVKLLEARREIEILEARVAVRKAEIEEILARGRLRQAREKLSVFSAEAREAEVREYQLLLDDASRPSVPFPDSGTIPRMPIKQERQIKKAILDAKNRPILDAIDQPVIMAFPDRTPLEDVLKYVRTATKSDKLPSGIPIVVDAGLPNAEAVMRKEVTIQLEGVSLRKCLNLVLHQVDLTWAVKDGLLVISAMEKKESK